MKRFLTGKFLLPLLPFFIMASAMFVPMAGNFMSIHAAGIRGTQDTALAMKILSTPTILLAKSHPGGKTDGIYCTGKIDHATAYCNIIELANGQKAARSSYYDPSVGQSGPGGSTRPTAPATNHACCRCRWSHGWRERNSWRCSWHACCSLQRARSRLQYVSLSTDDGTQPALNRVHPDHSLPFAPGLGHRAQSVRADATISCASFAGAPHSDLSRQLRPRAYPGTLIGNLSGH